jgi:hypothetical protein
VPFLTLPAPAAQDCCLVRLSPTVARSQGRRLRSTVLDADPDPSFAVSSARWMSSGEGPQGRTPPAGCLWRDGVRARTVALGLRYGTLSILASARCLFDAAGA